MFLVTKLGWPFQKLFLTSPSYVIFFQFNDGSHVIVSLIVPFRNSKELKPFLFFFFNFLVGGVICRVNSINERASCCWWFIWLLNLGVNLFFVVSTQHTRFGLLNTKKFVPQTHEFRRAPTLRSLRSFFFIWTKPVFWKKRRKSLEWDTFLDWPVREKVRARLLKTIPAFFYFFWENIYWAFI